MNLIIMYLICYWYIFRLSFPGQVAEEGSSCKYEVDSGTYNISILKVTQGEHFDNLDLLTTLLNNTKPKKFRPLIEVVSNSKCLYQLVSLNGLNCWRWLLLSTAF